MLPWLKNVKERFWNHKKLFNHIKYKNGKVLSQEFWKTKKCNGTTKIIQKIIRMCRSYNPDSKLRHLCLNQKYEIATYKEDILLNKRSEIINTCRHGSINFPIVKLQTDVKSTQ